MKFTYTFLVYDLKPFGRYFGQNFSRNFGRNVTIKYSSFRWRPLQSISAERRSYGRNNLFFGGCFGEKLTSFGPFRCTVRYTGTGPNWDLPFGGLSVSAERQNPFRSYTTNFPSWTYPLSLTNQTIFQKLKWSLLRGGVHCTSCKKVDWAAGAS